MNNLSTKYKPNIQKWSINLEFRTFSLEGFQRKFLKQEELTATYTCELQQLKKGRRESWREGRGEGKESWKPCAP